jgi:AcrR family transcriptional regulator
MDLLRNATIELLESVTPDHLTIREIADRAGVSHRYVPDYFGGKAELFADIYPAMQDRAALVLNRLEGDSIRSEVVRFAQLAIWLSANREGGVPRTEQTIMARLIDSLISHAGIDEEVAVLLAQRLIAAVIVIAAFPDLLSDEPIDLAAHRKLDADIVAMLAGTRSARDSHDRT